MRKIIDFVVLLASLLATAPAFSGLSEIREVHYQMGTFLDITLWHEEPARAYRLLREAVREVHRLEKILSNYDPHSAVSRFNQNAGVEKMTIPVELHELLASARKLSRDTEGYFDVTVGPLVDLWRETLLAGRLPTDEVLTKVRRLVGYEKLKLLDNLQAELLARGMKIDVGGIGKGFAVDRIAAQLREDGVNAALINFGSSSIYAIGTPPGKQGWEIGIKGLQNELRGVLCLRDSALSTSSAMGKFWTVGGKRYGHLIDPKSGMPVAESRLATVITRSATVAEALTKPLVLRGEEALATVDRFDGSEAMGIATRGSLFFSHDFRSKTCWREVPTS